MLFLTPTPWVGVSGFFVTLFFRKSRNVISWKNNKSDSVRANLPMNHMKFTDAKIGTCRKAISESSKVEIRKINYEGDALLPGTIITVSVNIYDQFGQFRNMDNSTYVSAKIEAKGADGAQLEGGRVNVTKQGVASFTGLSVSQEGNFTLVFSIYHNTDVTDNEKDNVKPGKRPTKKQKEELLRQQLAAAQLSATSVQLRVGKDPTEAKLEGECNGLFSSFSCMKAEPGRLDKFESIAKIPYPLSLHFISCIDILESAGFIVSTGWDSALWLWSKSSIALLGGGSATEDNDLLPTQAMNHWNRLGVEVGASKSQIKKAYFKKSLEWHPDRWVSYPHYKNRAKEIFALISEAYRELNEGPIKKRKEASNIEKEYVDGEF